MAVAPALFNRQSRDLHLQSLRPCAKLRQAEATGAANMKAWKLSNYLDDENITFLVHAETRNKAKFLCMDRGLAWDLGAEEYISICAKRVPFLDDKPFNIENVKASGVYQDDEEEPLEDVWYNECHCEVCRNELKPQEQP
jgi:hypothetical protein